MTHSSFLLWFFWSSSEESPSRPLTSSLIRKGSRLVVTSTSTQLHFCEQSCSCCCCRGLRSNLPKLNYKKNKNNDPRMISLKVATAATTTLMREKKKINAPGRNSNVDRHGGRKCGETGARKLILAQTWQHVSHSSHSQTRCDHKAGSDSSRRPQTESEAGKKKINKKKGGGGERWK